MVGIVRELHEKLPYTNLVDEDIEESNQNRNLALTLSVAISLVTTVVRGCTIAT